jgi:hypothetical protein
MIIETTYERSELKQGVCSCCSEESNEIPKWDTRCVDCIQMNEFEDATREAIDSGGGCSVCGDISGFNCACEDFEY